MKNSSALQYTVRSLVVLGQFESLQTVSVSWLAEYIHAPQKFLERLFRLLRQAGIVTSVRGSKGGYKLAKPLSQINMAMLAEAIHEEVDWLRCGGAKNCEHGQKCESHDVWESFSSRYRTLLHSTTLESIRREKNFIHVQT